MSESPLRLTLYPDPILRQVAPPVQKINDELRERVDEMFDVMYEHHGIGLAAPQVSWSTRLFIVNTEGDPEEGEERVYINPSITHSEGETTIEEGCLSLPDIRGKVQRPEIIRVKAQNLDGEWFEEDADEMLARVIQHELDHLDGILFIQRLRATDRLLLKKPLAKLRDEASK